MLHQKLTTALAAALVLGSAGSAFAQSTGFNIEQFEPLPSQRTNTLNVARSDVLGHLKPSVGLFFHFQDDPLQLQDDDRVYRLMDDQLKGELSLGLGLFDFADLGVVIPVALYQTGEAAPQYGYPNEISGAALQDMRLVPKVRFINPEWAGGFGAALLVPVSLPTGDSATFATDGSTAYGPQLALDWSHDSGLKLAANLSYTLKDKHVAHNYTAGDALRWAGGVEVPLGSKDVIAMGSVFGSYGLEDGKNPNDLNEVADNAKARPIEALVGMKFELGSDLLATAGGGAGISGGVGSPDFRLFTGLEWSPTSSDRDQDGIDDSQDDCPDNPEDSDGFEDLDGCPDPDNDEDKILDVDDQCPNQPEDVDTFEDENGCPDPDNDQDGVLDVDDTCPLVAGPKDNKGCPVGDADGDGLLDNVDKCVDQPEDFDKFEDEDGCPDPDNDKDGILDGDDQCPLEPETINGNKDEDGCPDKGKTKVVVTAEKIEILEKVYFDTNKAKIKKRSFNILNQVASVLKAHPEIKMIRVEGHTDDRGGDKSNLRLSQRRADSVKKYLIDAGVAQKRLVAKGFGESTPIANNKTRKGREKNRRVEFKIVSDGHTNVHTK